MSSVSANNDENIVWHQHMIDKSYRAGLKQQKPAVLWFTGLSGAGKSTIAGRWKHAWQSRAITPTY